LKKTQNKREEEEEDVNSCWMTLREEEILKSERRSTRSHSLENPHWKRLWTCRKK